MSEKLNSINSSSMKGTISSTIRLCVPILLSLLLLCHLARAANLTSPINDTFGCAASRSGSLGLLGASLDNNSVGSAFVFPNLTMAGGTIPNSVKLVASDGARNEDFGYAVSLSGTIGLVGALADDGKGAAYAFRNLNVVSGTITEAAKLIASDGQRGDDFGAAVSLEGSLALVGARADDNGQIPNQGAAYVFRSINTASGTINESAKLIASDGVANDFLGISVSLSGNMGLVGAYGHDDVKGCAYVFRNLNTSSGSMTQAAKLTASDGAAYAYFGYTVSLSGSTGLIGAKGENTAYLFRNLDSASGTTTESAKLVPPSGLSSNSFGCSVSLSGTTGLVGAKQDRAAFLFPGLNAATGIIQPAVKLTESNGGGVGSFGYAVSLDGDGFIISCNNSSDGAFSGNASAFTTMNAVGVNRTISKLSFVSQVDWVISETTSYNALALSAGDRADITAIGKGVYIGKNFGANSNRLFIDGIVAANAITIGATSGTTGNMLQVGSNGFLDNHDRSLLITVNSSSCLQIDRNNFLYKSDVSIIVAPSATLNLNYSGIATIYNLSVNGVARPKGFYDASTDPGFIMGSGKLRVVGGGYDFWSSEHAGSQGISQDYDNDGVPNGVEYFMGNSAGSVMTNPPIVDGIISWPMNPYYVGSYTVQTSPNLIIWTDVSSMVTGDKLIYTVPTDGSQLFVRLKVTPAS